MASHATPSIPICEQHAFLDFAKKFDWAAVKRLSNANPLLVNVQPCGQAGARWSALHQAAFGGSADAVRFLLEHKAAVDVKTKEGQTPLDVAKTDSLRAILGGAPASHAVIEVPTPFRARTRAVTGGKVAAVARKKAAVLMKVMKAMKVKTTRSAKIAKGKYAKMIVYKGEFVKTVGGLSADDLMKNMAGKVVSKRMQARGKQAYANIKPWVEAMMKARIELGLSGFVAVRKGSPLHAKTLELYRS